MRSQATRNRLFRSLNATQATLKGFLGRTVQRQILRLIVDRLGFFANVGEARAENPPWKVAAAGSIASLEKEFLEPGEWNFEEGFLEFFGLRKPT